MIQRKMVMKISNFIIFGILDCSLIQAIIRQIIQLDYSVRAMTNI